MTSNSVYGSCRSITSFEKLNHIGEGTYGLVYRARDRHKNQHVALKKIILHNEAHDGFPLTTIREIATLNQIQHDNCVQLLDVAVGKEKEEVYLVFEYCEHDMAHIMDNIKYHFSESEVKCITMQLLSALAYLHGKWIIHRDIKLSNLLYNRFGGLKLADFGLARTYSFPPRSMTNKVVSLWYRAPELLFQSRYYNPGIDVWSVGCVLGELLTNRPLLPGKTDLEQMSLIFELFGAPTDQIWPDIYSYPLLLDNPTYLVPYQRAHVFNRINTRILDIGEHGYNFINSLMMYDPKRRITVRSNTSENSNFW